MPVIDLLIAVVGAALVLFGADKLTDGSVGLARRFNISEMVIGLTVVAFGTSLPEFVVSLMASLRGAAAMGIGNVVGSNLFNTLMIVGVTAAIAPIAVQKSTIRKDIPFSLLASIVLGALALDHFFGASGTDVLERGDGIALLGFFAVFMAYSIAIARPDGGSETAEIQSEPQMSMTRILLFIVLGLAGLIGGGELFVHGATGIARDLGVSEAVIGLTLVAGGTSLPELATSVVAARKGQSGMAIGNVIGSNLFNIFWILGVCSCITPMPVAGISPVDFGMLVISGLLFWFFSKTQHRILRWEGILLVAVYVVYILFLIYQ
ncbi:MAG: calcium/sodium antiporter [Bacteroidaceae bacterium]|nr:calcium/sodium antiporter [Bacteroidaceae bacterium]